MFCTDCQIYFALFYRFIFRRIGTLLEEFVKFYIFVLFSFALLLANANPAAAQADSVIGQLTNSAVESFAGGISGDGRLVVFESFGNIATENPRNLDGNREIFVFDYAQRRIFQITDTKSLLINDANPPTFQNTKVVISNLRPVMSNDGRWIAFGSNANSVANPSANLTPGNFDARILNDASGANPLTADGNTELWLYQIPQVAPVNLSSGSEIPVTNLSAGTFLRATHTPASFPPSPGTSTSGPIIADDNRESSISDDGSRVAFTSTRDIVTGGNSGQGNVNDEIFVYLRGSGFGQVTRTTRGTISAPIYNQSATISGNGLRVAFLSNADNPVFNMTGGSNSDKNIEVFYTDLDLNGVPTQTIGTNVIGKQVSVTTRANAGEIVNILDLGRRMSRDGRYIAFDSYADLANENGGANQTSFALYLFDTTNNAFRRIGPRSEADAAASGGDVARYPGFTDTDANGAPATLVLETRLNIKADGTVAAVNDEGLNPNAARPAQIYSYPLNTAPSTATFTRLTRFPTPNFFLASTQPIPSDSIRRMTFTLALTELGTGNPDFANEAFYFLLPEVVTQNASAVNFATGASNLAVSASPVPTPTASPSPTPQTPVAVQGVAPGMLAAVNFTGSNPPVFAQTAVGSLSRRFTLPIQLSGVTMTINGAACGLKSVSQNQIVFVVPPGLSPGTSNATSYPVVIINQGDVIKGSITIVPARPDVFTFSPAPAPGGRARLGDVNNALRAEPFPVITTRCRICKKLGPQPTVLRLFLTGVNNISSANISIRIGTRDITGAAIKNSPVLVEPGVYTIDFTVPVELRGATDVPVVVTVTINGVAYQSRLDDTAPRTSFLP